MNILITGGSSGLGKSITECLSAMHPQATIYFTYNSSADAALEIETKFSNTKAIQLDFKKEKSILATNEKITSLNIDVLINNAVTSLHKNHFHKTTAEIFSNGFSDNILPVIKITAAFIKAARLKKAGKIITILSAVIAGSPLTGWASYTAEKNYLLSLTKSWASENAQFNIQSNCISPDFMDTPLNRGTDTRVKEEIVKSQPLKKLLTVEEVADTVKFLVTAPAHLTGQNIFLNNGKN